MVHIIDDEEGIRRALTFMLRKAGFGVTCWASGKAFVDQLRRLSDGCVLLDIRMPDMDGLEVQEAMLAAGCTLPVIVLTGHGDVSSAVMAMKAGAIDFLEKPFECDHLLQAIELAFGRIEQAEQIEAQTADASLKIAALTSREQEILNGLALGLPNKTIAYDLGISARTVEVHRANLMMKLRVRSFPEALRIAFAAGLGA
jgi:two-component system response regulator FixJ